MAEPRKVQFVTLSAFAAGAAAESRKRRLEDEADFNFVGAGEVEAATGAGGAASNGRLGKTGDRDTAVAEKRVTVRLNLSLPEPDDRSSAEFNYGEIIQNIQAKNNPPSLTSAHNPNDHFDDEERERLQVEALAKKFENKYGNTEKKKKKDRMQDLIDIGFGYDETDPFIDNSEAYDELVPASLTTKLGGFYINTGTLQFRATSDSEGEEDKKLNDNKEQVIKKRKKKEVNNLEENAKKNRGTQQGGAALNLHRPEKKKRKKLMKDSLYLAAMLRRFNREKEEMRKRNPNMAHPGLAGGVAKKPHSTNSTNHLLASNSTHSQDFSLADLTSDPAVMSLLGSANEKELQDLLGDLDFSVLDNDQQHVMVAARENGILGVGVPAPKVVAGGGGQGRGLGSSSGLFSPPPLPDGLPAPLIKRIEDLRAASRQFDQEGRKKFFTLDMNNILQDIELQAQEQPPEVRSGIYLHMEAFVPCNKEALLKRLKKLSLNIQDDRLRTPLLKLKLAVCSVMPEQLARYNMDCMAKVAKQQSEEGDKNGSEEEDEEKPGKRVMGPRKKFVWDDKLRNLLCGLVRVKLSCYEMENQCSLSVEDYLKAFLENEVKPLWPKGWMQARILLKESLSVHSHLTGNLVKRRMVPGPKAKAKEGVWIHKSPLTMTSTPSLPTSAVALTSNRQPPFSSSPPEPICLSDSLDEDLTAPSLDSISHALALLSNASKGISLSDSPLSPPPLQMPTSSPPPVTPHYPSASQLSASIASTTQQHSLSKVESTQLAAASAGNLPTTTLPTSSSTSSSSSPTASALARVQAAGLSLASRTASGPYSLIKASGTMGQPQTQRIVTMASSNHRPSLVMCGSGKMHPHPSPSPPKQRPPPTASPLLPPHQKGFVNPAGMLGAMGAPQGLAKSSAKASGINSNGSVSSSITPCSSPSSLSRSNSTTHPGLQSFCPPSPVASSPSPTSHTSHSSQGKSHTHHHHHQANFITPMQATLTKSSHSSNSSPIIKLTPRPPAPTPPPSPSPSSSPSHPLSHQMIPSQQQQHQYSPKTPKPFRPPFSVSGGGQVKQTQGSFSFAGGQKAQSTTSNSSINNNSINNKGVTSALCSRPDKTPLSSAPSVSANHGQRQRVMGGAQSSKTGNGWAASGTLATSSTTSHLSQVSTAGTSLLGSPSALPLGFGMLGGLVPVSLPFQFPSLLNFSPPGAPGAAGMGSVPSSNSGYTLAQSDLMDLYKSLQSGSQAALPPHLQLAFSDANQSQGGDMKRKSH
ncbi:ubinuclein-2a isoform X1 [Etheostoma spectabile]|uniref:ubinuclein-2a isoform X1 n=1 Tax=Etheostoma spectabile TaxID=54343 RepID=UPI0013AF7EF3|nr:ubinuclein-2 isoform X1 [Etheostoma spectabile]